MKLYKPEKQPPTVNINIKQSGSKTVHITGVLGGIESVRREVRDIIQESGQFSVFATGKAVTIEFREYIDGKNGKTKSLRLHADNPQFVKDVLMSAVEK